MKAKPLAIFTLAGALMACMAIAKDRNALAFAELRGARLEQSIPVTTAEWRGHAALIAFWRSDCAPCLKEMKILPDIATTNQNLPIFLISLQGAEHVRTYLAPMPKNVHVLVTGEAPKTVLSAFGNDRTLALPYSVMLDAEGQICDWHYGIIAPEKVKEWREKCS